MKKAVLQSNIQSSDGGLAVAAGATVTIRDSDTLALATLYTDRDGGTTTGNPLTADADGFFRAYVNPLRRYNITATSGAETQTFNDIIALSDSDQNQVQILDDLRAVIVEDGVSIFVKGHTAANDGGGGEFIGVTGASAGTYTDDDGVTILPTGGDGSAAWIRSFSGEANIKWFGAVGDGVADDTAAIQNAVALGRNLKIDEGTYLYDDRINITASDITIVNRGILKYAGTYNTHNPHINVTGNRVFIKGGEYDANGDIGSVFQFGPSTIGGGVSDAIFRNLLSKTELASSSGDFAAVVLKGAGADVSDCRFYDIINTDTVVTNDSFPRALTITGDYNTVSDCSMDNVQCPVITTGDYNHMKDILMDTVGDNGIYYSGNYNIVDGVVMIDMVDEPIVFSGTNNTAKNIVLDNTLLDRVVNSFGFQDATGAIIDGLDIRGTLKCASLFKNRVGNTATTATIKNVSGVIKGVYGVYEGTVGSADVEFINCNIECVKDTDYDHTHFTSIASGDSKARNCVFKLSDAAAYTSTGDTFLQGFSDSEDSLLNVELIQTSGSNFRINGRNAGVRFTQRIQASLGAIKSIDNTLLPRHFWGDGSPASGDWKVGDTVWNSAPSAGGTIGWVCTTAGTPGTWKTFGAITA